MKKAASGNDKSASKNKKPSGSSSSAIEITGSDVSIEQVWQVAYGVGTKLSLAASARTKITKSRKYIDDEVAKGHIMYGVNTGFGALSGVSIPTKDVLELQCNLIRSHASGVGAPFTPAETRAVMFLRANTLARGHSGIRPEVIDKILEFMAEDILPVLPCQGSLGASGDLAPLAHLALALMGEGEVWSDTDANGGRRPVATTAVLKKKGIQPLVIHSKEGLALINGCQVMTAIGMLSFQRALQLCLVADVAGSMSLEALRGSRDPFDAKISQARPHVGEINTASNLRRILGPKSGISESHKDCDRVQDAYSLRCMPAVHGAVKDSLRVAIETLIVEANSSTDNPLIFAETNEVLSCGNFHGEPVAFQMDFLGISMSALANISQCRISRLINPSFSRLPPFLAPEPGLNSGLMVVEYAAASLVSENKIHAHPASVDSIPTSIDKEDHVSMGTIGARKLKVIVENVANVLAMEILSAMQGLSLLRSGYDGGLKVKSAAGVLAAYEFLVEEIPLAKKDRVFANDIKKIRAHIDSGALLAAVEKSTGELEI